MIGLLFLFGCAKNSPISETTPVTPTSGTVTDTTTTAITNTWTETNADTRQTYESKTDKFTVQFPSTRTFQEDVFGSSVMFFTPVVSWDALRENVGIMKKDIDKAYTLDEYYALTKPELANLVPGFTEISKETIKVNDRDAQKLIYKWTQDGRNLEWEQIYLIKDKTVYIITYTATEATFSQYIQKIDEMAATLEIK